VSCEVVSVTLDAWLVEPAPDFEIFFVWWMTYECLLVILNVRGHVDFLVDGIPHDARYHIQKIPDSLSHQGVCRCVSECDVHGSKDSHGRCDRGRGGVGG
jgi:hypothetical protein